MLIRLSYLSPVFPLKIDDSCGSHARQGGARADQCCACWSAQHSTQNQEHHRGEAQRYRRPMVAERREYLASSPVNIHSHERQIGPQHRLYGHTPATE